MDLVTKLRYIDLGSTFSSGSSLPPRTCPYPSVKATSYNNSLKPSKSYSISNPAVKVSRIPSKLSAVAAETSTAHTDTREGIGLLFSDNSTHEFERKQPDAGASKISSIARLVNICKIYNGVAVLKNVNWEIAEGEKVGLVGVNGAGKTTQLRIIAGQEKPDFGYVIKAKNTTRIAFWSQESEVSMTKTVKEEFLSVFTEEMDIAEKSEKVQKERVGASDDSELTRRLVDEFDTLQRCNQAVGFSLLDAKINTLIGELGFVPEDSDRLVPSFGNGWQIRISLGKILLQDPDLLLLDEPTNHLDLDTVSWLAGYLKKQDVSIVIVSHDGAFLDHLCTKIVETDMGMSTTYQGNYSDYVIAKEIEQTRNMVNRLVAGVNAGRACITDKPEFETSLTSKTSIEDEAVVAAAAAEAVALAKAAVKFAKDAATMAQGIRVVKLESEPGTLRSGGDSVNCMDPELLGCEHSNSDTNINGASECHLTKHHICDPDDLEPTIKELEVLRSELSKSIAVRSERQMERRAKRARAAEKATVSVEPIKLGHNSRKRRTSPKDVDNSDPLRHLRGTTGSSKLLTVAEELEFSGGIQDLLRLEKLHDKLQERYSGEPTFAQWAAAAGVDQKTLRKRLNYGILCKDKMIKSNIRLVISIAKNYVGGGMNLQDLVQEGCRGLIRGAEKFDASKGFKFSTYAHWWIKQAVRKSLADQSRTIRLPFHMVADTYRVIEAKKQLYSENGRHPKNEEVAEATGLSMKRLKSVLLTPKAPRSLDQKIGIDQNLKPSDVIADPEAESAEDLMMKQFMRQDLEKALDSLREREKQVIRWRFGMEDGRMKTLQEIGEIMGVSRERIRQIELSAFRKLDKKKTKLLQQYLFP